MSTKLTALKLAAAAAKHSMGPQQYKVQGKILTCQICGHNRFSEMNMGILGASSLVCGQCEHLELFVKRPAMAMMGPTEQ
jgi:hypothetical protein